MLSYRISLIEYLLEGRKMSVTSRIAIAVIARLIGYTVIIVMKVGDFLNAVKIHARRTPQIPAIAHKAGTSDAPQPRKYPERTSCAKLNMYPVKRNFSLISPISITPLSRLNIAKSVREKIRMSEHEIAMAAAHCARQIFSVERQRSFFPAPKFCPTNVEHACPNEFMT